MSDTIREYLSTPSPSRVDSPKQTQQWLEALLAGGLPLLGSVSDSIRAKLASAVLNDIEAASGMREGDPLLNARSDVRWNSAIRLSALKLLKELSRLPGGSTPLAKPESLRTLLQQVDFPKQRSRRSPTASTKQHGSRISTASTSSTSSSFSSSSAAATFNSIAKSLRRAVSRRGSQQSQRSSSKDKDLPSSDSSGEEYGTATDPDWPITDMALRCLNNALFLNENARLPFSSDEIGGGHAAVALLSQPQDTPADILFLGARLLFFSTLFESPFNKTAVTALDVVRIEAACVDALVKATLEKAANKNAASSVLVASGSEAQLSTALSDLLKAHFNICLYYPRIVKAEVEQQGSATSKSNADKGTEKPILGEGFDSKLLAMLPPLVAVLTALPLPSPVPLMPPFTHAIAALLNYPVVDVKAEILAPISTPATPAPAFTSPISPSSSTALESAPPYINRLITFTDLMLARYLSTPLSPNDGRRVPEDVDAKSIKLKSAADGVELEDTLEPLLLLLRKTAAEDTDLRTLLLSILLPADLDRSLALDRRTDVLGRLVRLMSSVTLPRTARASGELLLALREGDAKRMSDTIGYGPCAGFLMNTGLASALPTGTTQSNGRSVNPVTGEYETVEEDEISKMSEEEKEREAERLFVLFDRLNRTGVVQARHPVAAAQEQGRFEEIEARAEEEERKRREEEEEETERAVEREMAAHRARTRRGQTGEGAA